MKTIPIQLILKSIIILLMVLVFSECSEKVKELPKSPSDLVISEYLNATNEFSEFNALLVSTGLDNLLGIRGPYTLFLPNNAALQAYYTEKNITLAGMDSLSRRELVMSHIVSNEYGISDFQLGTLRDKNGNGDNVVTEFQGAEILINKTAKIVKRDIRVSNGTIQVIDKVLDPIKLSVYDKLASDPAYSIFTKGLELTGIKDTLQLISFPYGQTIARTRFTILAVADSTYNRFQIHDINDLIAHCTNKPDSVSFPNNGFYIYMDYHCLNNNTMYLNDFTDVATPYYTLSKNSIVQGIVDNGVHKFNRKADKTYTGIYVELSDIPAKNGVIHTLKSLLDYTVPVLTPYVWEVTDYFDLKQEECYLKHFQKFFDTAQFPGIWWKGEYLQYYIKPTDAPVQQNYDCLNMYGFWEIEVTTPRIMKGNYKVNGRVWAGYSDMKVYIDGEAQPSIITGTPAEKGNVKIDTNPLFLLATVSWNTTTEHKIKLVALTWGMLFWDRVEFIPVN
jgi:uncharacterized surface protein with fasciclin (FAS1) repeats